MRRLLVARHCVFLAIALNCAALPSLARAAASFFQCRPGLPERYCGYGVKPLASMFGDDRPDSGALTVQAHEFLTTGAMLERTDAQLASNATLQFRPAGDEVLQPTPPAIEKPNNNLFSLPSLDQLELDPIVVEPAAQSR